MSGPNTDKHVVTYESKAGKNWTEHTMSLPSRVRIGAVLKEMRSQDVIRNVKLVSSATC